MKYIGHLNERSNQPKFHVSKGGAALCGVEVTNGYEREGLPNKYFLCPTCNRMREIKDARPDGGMTNGERAAMNIQRCREFLEAENG